VIGAARQELSGTREMIGSVLLKIGQEVTAVLGKKKIAPSFSFDQMTLNLPRTPCKF
jgi:hypothetical protein